MSKKVVNIIGGGLAGSEAAYQLAKRNINVNLFEMRPKVNLYVQIVLEVIHSLMLLVCLKKKCVF